MKIVHVTKEFFDLSGATIYIYELAREQVKCGHQVTICAPVMGGEIARHALSAGVTLQHPGRLANCVPDIYHVHHPNVVGDKTFAHEYVITTLHDLQDKLERRGPFKRIIVVREDQLPLVPGAVWIPNPVDTQRFHPSELPRGEMPQVLCVGNFRDARRKPMLEDLLAQAGRGDIFLRVVGNGIADRAHQPNISVHYPVWDIEIFLRYCTCTAGLYVGRTTLEGWLCGRAGYVYQPDGSKELRAPPADAAQRFSAQVVARRVEEVYQSL